MDSCLRDSLCDLDMGTGVKGLYALSTGIYPLKNAHNTVEGDIMFSYTVVGHGGDEHTTALSTYFDISDHLQYSCDIWTQCTTQTLF